MGLKACIFILSTIITTDLVAQNKIEGRVFDVTNNKPLAGATVTDPDGDSGTITDRNGYFSWMPQVDVSEIQVSYIGYQPRMLPVHGDKFYNIGLKISDTQLQEVVISAYRNEERYQDIPGSISLISINDMERGSGIAITPALNRIPSVYMHSGALNTNRITIRGIGSRSPFSTTKIRAYLNEIPLTTGTGETTIEDIDLGIVERVEVIKGPSSSIYGAGLGGTINYSVKKSAYENTTMSIGSKVGSYGLLGTSASFQHGSDFGNINLAINNLHSDGYRENNQYDRRSYSFAGQLYAGKKGLLTLIGNWIDLKAFIPSSVDKTTYEESPQEAAFTWKQVEGFEDYAKNLIGLNYIYDINPSWIINSSLFTSGRDSYELRPFNILTEDALAYGVRSFGAYSNEEGDLLSRFNLGFEYFNEDYDWKTLENNTEALLSDNTENRQYYNVFTQLDLSISYRLKLIMGLNINNTAYEIMDLYEADTLDHSGDYSFETQWSPRVAFTYKSDPNLTIYGNISHGFSPPTLEETLTPDGQVNPDIKPESGYNFEIGSRGTLIDTRLFFDISVYTMLIDNLLVAERVMNDIFIGVNAGKTTHSGLDLTLNHDLLRSTHPTWSKLNLFLNYMFAHYRFKEFIDGEEDHSGNDLTGTPPHKLNAGIDLGIYGGLYGSMEYQFVDKMPMNDENTAYSEKYSLFNVKLGLEKSLGQKERFELDIFAGINNVLDEKYASMIAVNAPGFGGNPPRYYYPGLPRNYYGGVELVYRFR